MGLDRTRSRLRFPGSSLLLFLNFNCGLFFFSFAGVVWGEVVGGGRACSQHLGF